MGFLLFHGDREKSQTGGEAGFTLIELTVVVALVGIVMVFALPRVDSMMAGRDADRISRRLSLTMRELRTEAVRNQVLHTLHLDLDAQRIWWSRDGMSETDLQNAYARSLVLAGDVVLLDVAYPGERIVADGQADIRFFPKGYSEMAVIHLTEGEGARTTLRIEPFLPGCRVYEGYVALSDPLPG
jgi:prepilin-type N-terminal cleavage/methylation domain-containing protein